MVSTTTANRENGFCPAAATPTIMMSYGNDHDPFASLVCFYEKTFRSNLLEFTRKGRSNRKQEIYKSNNISFDSRPQEAKISDTPSKIQDYEVFLFNLFPTFIKIQLHAIMMIYKSLGTLYFTTFLMMCCHHHYHHVVSGFQNTIINSRRTTAGLIFQQKQKQQIHRCRKRNISSPVPSSKNPNLLFGSLGDDNDTNNVIDNDLPQKPPKTILSSKTITDGADDVMRNMQLVEESTESNTPKLNRRLFFGAALLGASSAILVGEAASASNAATTTTTTTTTTTVASSSSSSSSSGFDKLKWESTPVNKRTGVTVFDAEKAGYNVRFITYLSRFLLAFDIDCQRWWYSRAADIPRKAKVEEVEAIRLRQFGAFSASVEVGLQEYRGPNGPAKLMEALLIRYSPDMETVKAKRAKRGLSELTPAQEAKEIREIKEARRQIALLFGLMEKNQPVEQITRLLAAIDNGSIESVVIEDGGSGYAPGYGPPVVQFSPPEAGPGYRTATGRAKLSANGKILRVDFVNRGFGYSKPPTVMISPPGADRGVEIPGARAATAKASLFKGGPNKGRLQSIQIDDPGEGYNDEEKIKIMISPPELSPNEGGVKALANPVLEYSVSGIDIVDGGSGYAIEKPLPIYVEPPPLTARVDMNDPLSARIIDPNKPIPASDISYAKVKNKMTADDKTAFMTLVKNSAKVGGGGCIGRSCYDTPVMACGEAVAELSSFTKFRTDDDARAQVEKEEEVLKKKIVSGTSSGPDAQLPLFWTGAPSSSSSALLTLLPAGLGLEYDEDLKRYVLSAGSDFIEVNEGSSLAAPNTPLDPEFGPRGRSPIERDLTLDWNSFARFCASGAICAAGSHFVLTPLDVVKTKIQTDRENYPGVVSAFKKLLDERGLTGFFAGWVPTTVGFFLWGAFTYSTTELLRRYFSDQLGSQAASYDVPIILSASAIAAFFSVFILGPFEAIRIRSVAQPDYGKNFFDVTRRLIQEEGITSFFSATVPLLFKEIPFGVTKFFVFGIATRFLYNIIPAAQEDIQLSLFISLAGGMVGGLAAAIVSNPADATISEMKKAKSDIGPYDAAKSLVEQGGFASLMSGLPVRMAFYPLIVSIQFTVYDAVRIYLGVGSDDLKVYLDVLGGALKDGGSMVGPV